MSEDYVYDPLSDPRSLHRRDPDPEQIAKLQDQWNIKQRELDNLSAQLAMFRSRAWLSLVPEWEMQRSAALSATADTRLVNSMDKLANIQGQVAVLDRLLNLPTITKNRQKLLVQEMRQLRQVADEYLDA